MKDIRTTNKALENVAALVSYVGNRNPAILKDNSRLRAGCLELAAFLRSSSTPPSPVLEHGYVSRANKLLQSSDARGDRQLDSYWSNYSTRLSIMLVVMTNSSDARDEQVGRLLREGAAVLASGRLSLKRSGLRASHRRVHDSGLLLEPAEGVRQ